MTTMARGETAATFMTLLKGFRVRAGLTQEELSAGSGISVRAISDMERGIARHPQRRTVELLAESLSLSDDELAQLKDLARRGAGSAPAAPVGIYSPPQVGLLPSDAEDLTGREREIRELRTLAGGLAEGRRRAGKVVILSGPPGTGKTTLSIRTARDLEPQFPDGRVFVRLRGMSTDATDPEDALHLILRSLGIDAVRIPAGLEERMDLCRSLLQERAVLLVLDDAADEAQVRPLLVGGPRCLTLITGRQMLVGIEGADRMSLDVLDTEDAVALLSSIIGSSRVRREKDAARELIELCGGLPLALRIAGNRLASRPSWPIERLVDQLRDHNRRLTVLTAGDLDVRSVFDMSYRQLATRAAALFRRLALVPAADFSSEAAMALIDTSSFDEADVLVEELVDASLLQTSALPGRYQFHALLRAFAAERLTVDETAEQIELAETRLAHWLVATATAAGGFFSPSGDASSRRTSSSAFRDSAAASLWLEAELTNWVSAVRILASREEHQAVLDLSESMHWYSEVGGTAEVWHEVFRLAVDAAVALGSRSDEAVHRNYLAWVLTTLLGRHDDAVRMSQLAYDAATDSGNLREQGWSLVYKLGAVRESDPDASAYLVDEAGHLFERAGYGFGLQVTRVLRATQWNLRGRYEEAAAEYEKCLRYFRDLHESQPSPIDETSYAFTLLKAANNLATLGESAQALLYYDQSLALCRLQSSAVGQALALRNSGRLLGRHGDSLQARSRLEQAAALYERLGMTQVQIDTYCDSADLADAVGDPVTARRDRERALALCDRLGQTADQRLREELTERLDAS